MVHSAELLDVKVEVEVSMNNQRDRIETVGMVFSEAILSPQMFLDVSRPILDIKITILDTL